MVNIKIPAYPIHKYGIWPPRNSVAHTVTAADNWESIAKEYSISVGDLIMFNFKTRIPEEINWYLRELVGCKNSGLRGHNYSFDGADPLKSKIYIPEKGGNSGNKNISDDEIILKISEMVKKTKGLNKGRLTCMVTKLVNHGDDRFLSWRNIGLIKDEDLAGLGTKVRGPIDRNNFGGMSGRQWMHDNLKTHHDVDRQIPHAFSTQIFMISLRKTLLAIYKNIPDSEVVILNRLAFFEEEMAMTYVQLSTIRTVAGNNANSEVYGSEYSAINSWMMRRANDPRSIISCVRTTNKTDPNKKVCHPARWWQSDNGCD